jgi:uncharacterized protein (TIGR02145 family)
MEHRFLDKSNQRRVALNIHNPVQVERSDTQLVTDGAGRAYAEQGKTTAYCLLLLLLWPVVLSAQNGVTLGNLVVNTGSPTTVTFNVSWDKNATSMPSVWSDTVWVFVDHNEGGVMKRLELLSAGATLTATSAPGEGRVEQLAGNHTGVRVIGNARTNSSFSATVRLLTATTNVAGACAYASNYPPVGEYVAGGSAMSFTGTPMYKIVLRPASGNTFTANSDGLYTIQAGDTIKSFTDKTGAPGIIKCIPMTGSLNFSVPSTVPKGQSTSFAVSVQPTVPAPSAITYTWSAPGFSPNTYTGTPFSTTAPAAANTYPVTLTARSEGYCDLPVTNNVTVIDCVTPTTYNLIASASGFCASDAGITFSLDDTQTGVKYRLYRDGTTAVGTELSGNGIAQTFSGSFKVGGTYTAKSVAESGYCAMLMTGSHPITANATPTEPNITLSSGNVCYNAGDLVFTATGYTGALVWNANGGNESGNSVTFVSGTSPDTKTVKAQSSQTYTNAQTCYSAEVTQTGTINALPNNPLVVAGERCGAGTVTLLASSSGAVIDWYADASGGTSLTTGPSYTPNISVTAPYYAEARFEVTGCVSARVPVSASVDACCTAPNATVNFTEFNPCANAATYSVWHLADTREAAHSNSQTYTVKLMNDGRYWMIQDMKFGDKCKLNSFNSTGTNTTGKVTSLSGTWYGNCTAATNTSTPAARGYLYDWAAAINKAGAFYGSTITVGCSGVGAGTVSPAPGACQGICPDGWHIPTGSAQGEGQRLQNLTFGCADDAFCCCDGIPEWSITFGGGCDNVGTLTAQGTFAEYWTSTNFDTKAGFVLAGSLPGFYPGEMGEYKWEGYTARCVRNY